MPSSERSWSDPERVAGYLSREIPHRDVAEQMLLTALPPKVDRFLDLGTGDGRLIALVRSAHPAAEGLGLDFSQAMLDRAAERFAGETAVELQPHDLRDPLPRSRPYDAIVSGLAIHHLEDERKRELFAEVRERLAPGGVFANLDLVETATPELHERFRREIGRPEEDPADRFAPLCDQLKWLRAAGFAEVECHFKWLQMTLFIAS